MGPQTLRCILLAILLSFATPVTVADSLPPPAPTTAERDREAFSDNLVVALASRNDGLRASAMRLIIHYSDRLDVSRATFDVVRIYRDHSDERMRHLAVVALSEIRSPWAVDFLTRSLPYERSPRVRRTIQAVLAATPTV